jgi:hypothetical protein
MSRLGQTRRTVVLAIAATLLLAGEGSAAFTPDVVGGSTASAGNFPWLAFVYDYEPAGVGLCTGTVIVVLGTPRGQRVKGLLGSPRELVSDVLGDGQR